MKRDGAGERTLLAFTLLEMIVVIGIIGIMAALALPSLKLGKGNTVAAAARQVMDDMALARLRAIGSRTTVYVVFMPKQSFMYDGVGYGVTTPAARQVYFTTNVAANALLAGQFTSYALFTRHSLGDQPGRDNPRYITEWKSLPDGVFFPPWLFTNSSVPHFTTYGYPVMAGMQNVTNLPADFFPVPDINSPHLFALPYVAFDSQGRLYFPGGGPRSDIALPISVGSLFVFRDTSGLTNQIQDPDVVEVPPGNWTNNYQFIRINQNTGRTKIERPQLP